MAQSSPTSRWEWLAGMGVALLPTILILVPLFTYSANVHTPEESTAFDRLALSIRTFWPHAQGGLTQPATWAIDTNFPLGTAFVFALPRELGLDALFWARFHSAAWSVVSTMTVFLLLCRPAGPLFAGLAGAWLWTVPAFARGAVVSGEEAPYLGLMLLGLFGLLKGRWWAVAACVAVNGLVLFRLDAVVILPVFALIALALLGWRGGLIWSLATGLSTALHLAIANWLTGDPLSFARRASNVTKSTSFQEAPFSSSELVGLFGDALGGQGVLVASLAGLFLLLLRGGREGRTFATLALGLAVAYVAVGALGILKIRFLRYLVPVLALMAAAVPMVGALLWVRKSDNAESRRWTTRATRLALAALFGMLFAVQLRSGAAEMTRQGGLSRPPEGLEAAAHWLAMCGNGGLAFSTSNMPALAILGPLPPTSLTLLKSRWNAASPPPVADQLAIEAARFVVLVGTLPTVQLFKEARLPEWQFAWQEGRVVIYARAVPEELARLRRCTRWGDGDL